MMASLLNRVAEFAVSVRISDQSTILTLNDTANLTKKRVGRMNSKLAMYLMRVALLVAVCATMLSVIDAPYMIIRLVWSKGGNP